MDEGGAMGKMCIMHWGNEKLLQAFECKIWKEVTTWEPFAETAEWYENGS
jgi:hypothetical protein